jgi:CheY-like chemotaxis protein
MNNLDMILMDIMMPEMDGYETIKKIRKECRKHNIPIIAVTAKAMKGDRDKSITAGASDYVTKPVNLDNLLSLMRIWMYQ